MRDGLPSPWQYLAFADDTPPEAFGIMSPFVDLWRQKWPSPDRFPTWTEFDIVDFERWWGKVSLMEIHRDPFDVRWALWGSAITQWWGMDYTNKRISEIPEVHDVWEKYERPYLERLADERLIGFVTGTLAPQDRDFLYICGIDLPLEKNGVVTHILSAYQLRDPENNFLPGPKPHFVIE